MKILIALIPYAIASGLIGLIAVGSLLYFKKPKFALFAALVLFGGPMLTYVAIYLRDTIEQQNFIEDVAYVQNLCKKYGGDKVYRTVENVEGIFRIRERHPDRDEQLRSQFGMIDPYGAAQGDPSHIDELLSDQRLDSQAGYIFVETQPGYNQAGPPYRRFYLKPTGRKIGDQRPAANKPENPELKIVEIQVHKLASRFGYVIEDLSTPELRRRWIGGGRIKIIDLHTNEVLAERTGYFRAPGKAVQLHWSGVDACRSIHSPNSNLKGLLFMVLKPVANQPLPQYSKF